MGIEAAGATPGNRAEKRARDPESEEALEATQRKLANVAGRATVGNTAGVGAVLRKGGIRTTRMRAGALEEEVLVLGGACSEVFSGPRLARVLRPAVEHQTKALAALEAEEPCSPLSVHTSVGVPASLGAFVEVLEQHLPWKGDDWFVTLQIEGTTAVWAAVEALMKLQDLRCGSRPRTLVAVGEGSYHGPKTTGLGQPAQPRWPNAPRTRGQVPYPCPLKAAERGHEQTLRRFDEFLDKHGDQTGVMIVEPQWGSTAAGMPWPKELLREVVRRARSKGILVLCDEIMCGLGRHGEGTLFLSQAWGLEPDAVTFGKAVAAGFPLSGCAVRSGRDVLSGSKLQQSHTYAGSSALALMTAKEVLDEVPRWFGHAKQMERLFAEVLGSLNDGAFLEIHGKGLMWGGLFVDPDPARRQEALRVFQALCGEARVWPYFVPVGGFMMSPPMDVEEADLREGLERVARCLTKTREKMGLAA